MRNPPLFVGITSLAAAVILRSEVVPFDRTLEPAVATAVVLFGAFGIVMVLASFLYRKS